MKHSETVLLFLIAFFIVWVFTCIFHPLVGLMMLYVVFVMLLGLFFLLLIALWYQKPGRLKP